MVIIGLAPGLKGANRTGRPFTGDYAGVLLYETLIKFGFAQGTYHADPKDGLELQDCMIMNAVRCVPPENKPTPAEIKQCRPYLLNTLQAMPNLQHILVLGRIAHETIVRAFDLPLKSFPFAHGAVHKGPSWMLHDSYHCSRYNTQTGVLTQDMFEKVVARLRAHLAPKR